MMIKGMVGLAAVCLGVLAPAGPAWADPGGAQRFTITGSAFEETARVAAAGVITGVGTDVPLSLMFGPNGTLSGTDRFDFRGGSVEISFSGTLTLDADPATCVVHVLFQGGYTIDGGSGAYSGAAGRGTFTDRETVVTERSGAGCTPLPRVGPAHAALVGTLALPG